MDSAQLAPRRSRVGLWLAGFLLACFVYFLPRPGDWNQDARLDLDLAIVNHGTVAIDGYQWNTGWDHTFNGGHYYLDKAPGQSLVGVPVFAAFKGLLSLGGHRADANRIGLGPSWHKLYGYYYLAQCLETMYTVAIPSMFFLLLFFWFLGYFSRSVFNRVLLTLALGLATSVFPYSQVFYPHVPTAGLLLAGFVLLYIVTHKDANHTPRARWLVDHPALALSLAGGALSTAVFLDHTSALIGGLIGLYAAVRVPFRLWPYLILGAVPALAGILGYDYAAFHNPHTTGYTALHLKGIGGSGSQGTPHTGAVFGMTFSPYRGLFFLSPFLLLAFPGYVLWARRGGQEWLLCLVIPVALFVAVSTVYFWDGGASVGPRYLIAGLPFLTLPIIFVLDRARSWPARTAIYLLMGASLVNVWLQSLGGQGYPKLNELNPLFSISLPNFVHGDVPLSLGTVLLYVFTGAKSTLTLLPLLGFLAVWSLAFARRGRPERPGRAKEKRAA